MKNDKKDLVPLIPYDDDGTGEKKKPGFKEKIAIVKNRVSNYMLDHPNTNFFCDNFVMILITVLSSFIFAYGFLSFTNPLRVPFTYIKSSSELMGNVKTAAVAAGLENVDDSALKEWYNSLNYNDALAIVGKESLVSGGASGMSQVIARILAFTGLFVKGSGITENTVISILYILVNLPFIFLAWRKIGHKFTVYTLLNIIMASVFLKVIPASWCELTNIYTDYLARALAGGICTGFSTGLAFSIGSSSGAVDIISFYFAEKKSTSVGKYSMFVNVATVVIYTLLHFIQAPSDLVTSADDIWNQGVSQTTMALYTIVYFFTSAKLLDLINIKNKKVELQVFTSRQEMSKVLVSAFPHACTVVEGKGGYSGGPRYIIYMVVSKNELNKSIEVMKSFDPNCFVSVLSTFQVYGNFYIKPVA